MKRNIPLFIVFVILHGVLADDHGPYVYTEDIFIGRSQLFDNGNVWTRANNDYGIMLLQVEGSTDRYNLRNGFFVGFQWYNDKHSQQVDRVNLQLYRLNWTDSVLNEGEYILTHESGFLDVDAGFNTFFFNDGIRFDIYDNVNDSYYMAIMMEKTGRGPVLFETPSSCSGQTNVVLESNILSRPRIGDSVYFAPDKGSTEWCASYSIRGIFLPTDLASYTSGNCSLHLAMNNEYSTIFSHTPYYGYEYQSNGASYCQILRAEKPGNVIAIKTLEFELSSVSQPSNCDFEPTSLQISDQNLLSDPGTNLWDKRYCGKDIFDVVESSRPYVMLNLLTSSSSVSGLKGYKFEIKSHVPDNSGTTLAIILGVTIPASIIILVCLCVCCITLCTKNKKKKVHGNTAQTNQRSTGHSYNNTGYTHNRQPQSQNRLPPLGQPMPNNAYGTQYGFQSVTPSAPPSNDAPPAYGSVFGQQPGFNQQPGGKDPFGVPPPALYVEPTKPAPY